MWTWLSLVACGPELPDGWKGAEPVADFEQRECAGSPYEPYDTAVAAERSADTLAITWTNAHFRCAQDVEAFFDAEGARLLVQPVDLHPREVAGCDCLYDLTARVATDADEVAVWRRWDDWNDPNEPEPVGVAAVPAR